MRCSTVHSELQKVFRFPSKNYLTCSIDNLDDYKRIVSGPAYKDFTPRTIAGLKKENIQVALDWLAEEIYTYIHSDPCCFSEWHNDICVSFCKKIKELHGKIPYGKAQKILNMSMKYLFCLNDSQKYASKFMECHMAIDQFTLEWFIRAVLTEKNMRNISVGRIRETSWSKLECGEDENEEYSYLWLQKTIRDYLSSEKNTIYRNETGNKLTPFIAEFYIWPEMQMHLAMESLYSQGGEDQREFKAKSIPDKITALKDFLEKIEQSVKTE